MANVTAVSLSSETALLSSLCSRDPFQVMPLVSLGSVWERLGGFEAAFERLPSYSDAEGVEG